jgi:hypothetical protein
MAFRFFNKDGKHEVVVCDAPDCALRTRHFVVIGGNRLGKDAGIILTCDRCRAASLRRGQFSAPEIPHVS